MAWTDKIKRKEIFEDTIAFIGENETLRQKTAESVAKTKFYGEHETIELPKNPGKAGRLTVTEARSFEAAIKLSKEYPGKRIAVLNFASAARPGGGVEDGAGAQEESLCRVSTLFPTLKSKAMEDLFYGPHRREKNNLHNDDCIYSPDVIICKSDVNFPERISENEFVTVDVITCAAPNLNENSVKRYNPDAGKATAITNEQLYEIHLKRARRILSICARQGTDIVVLGAFGCGVFKNDPETVARAMTDAGKELDGYFECVDFAIKKGRDKSNYEAFATAVKNSN